MKTGFRARGVSVFRKAAPFLAAVAACLLTLTPMRFVARNFNSDWYNHLWLIEYAGHHLWLTGTAPEVLNTPQAIGIPILLFYAQKFYTVLGAPSFVLGSALTVRFAVFACLLLQFYHVNRAVRGICPSASIRLLLPILVTWQVFQETTLYERSDVTEYFAVVFLTVCISNLYALAIHTARRMPDAYGFWTTGFYYGLAALTHPLTALYGGAFVTVIGLAILIANRTGRLLTFALLNFLALAALLGSWVLVVVRYAKQASITSPPGTGNLFVGKFFTSPPLLTLWRAFSPTSFCAYTTRTSLLQVSADFNVQLSLPLLAVVVALLFSWKAFPVRGSAVAPVSRALLAIAYGVFWITLLVYCSPGCSLLFGHAFDILQFSFRLGAYVNLALLLAALALLGLVDWKKAALTRMGRLFCRWSAMPLILLSAVGWFSKGWFIEQNHFYAKGENGLQALLRQRHYEIRRSGYWFPGYSGQDDSHLTELPATGYFLSDYDVVAGLQDGHELVSSTRAQVLPLSLGEPFAAVVPAQIDLDERTLVMTNVSPFPWNELVLDGQPVSREDLFAIPSLYGVSFNGVPYPRPYAVFVDHGRHTLAYRFAPDQLWRWLNVLSWMTLAAWASASIVVTCVRTRSKQLPVLTA